MVSMLETRQHHASLAVLLSARGDGSTGGSSREPRENIGENKSSLRKRTGESENGGKVEMMQYPSQSRLSLPLITFAGSKSLPNSKLTSSEADPHIASKNCRLVKQFYLPRSASAVLTPQPAESPVSSSPTCTNDTSQSNSPRETTTSVSVPLPRSCYLQPPPVSLHRRDPQSIPSSPSTPTVFSLQAEEAKPMKERAMDGLFDITRYSHLGLTEEEIRGRLKKHSEWIRRGENGFFTGGRRKV